MQEESSRCAVGYFVANVPLRHAEVSHADWTLDCDRGLVRGSGSIGVLPLVFIWYSSPTDVDELVRAEAAAASEEEREGLRRQILDLLGDDDFETRDSASSALIETGTRVMPWLTRAQGDESDPEILVRLKKILEALGVDEILDFVKAVEEVTKLVVFQDGAERPDMDAAVAGLGDVFRELNARLEREELPLHRQGLLEDAIELFTALREELEDPAGDAEEAIERARRRLGEAIDHRFGDFDGDQLPTECEVRLGLNPTTPDSGDGDFDRDGTSDREEIEGGTDPTQPPE